MRHSITRPTHAASRRALDSAPARPAGRGMPRFMARAQEIGRAPLAVAPAAGALEAEAREASRADGGPSVAGPLQDLRLSPSPVARTVASSGHALDTGVRQRHEQRLGADLSGVRVHTGTQAALLAQDLGAKAFTQGSDIFFGAGRYSGDNELTAHELSHVVQQGGGAAGLSAAPGAIQCDLTDNFDLTNGRMEVDLRTLEGANDTPATHSGLDGYIRFVPGLDAPLSNQIEMVQIVKLTDLGGTDARPRSLNGDRGQRGGLGDPGLRTADNPLTGVEGGYFTDVQGGNVPQHDPLSTGFRWQPAGPGVTGTVGVTPQPAFYGGGTGGVFGRTPGFKRSEQIEDRRSAALYDRPGSSSPNANLIFEFETVARAQDKGINLGTALWGFELHDGWVENEHLDGVDAASVTFDEALERHRDYYVHEPVSFYFEFDSAVLAATEADRIDDFVPYLMRAGNAAVTLSLEGFADQVGGPGEYNARLSMRRVAAVEAALLAHGVPAARIDGFSIGHGASTAATADAGTGDQGGDPAVGADQSREANRWANRRVVVTFSHPAGP